MARKLSAELRIDVKTLNVKALDDLANKLARLGMGAGRAGAGAAGAAANLNASVERQAKNAERAIRMQINSAQMMQRQKETNERWSIRMQIASANMAAKAQAREEAALAKKTKALQTQRVEMTAIERVSRAQARLVETQAARRQLGLVQSPVEREVARFKALEERRTARDAARKQLGMGEPGSFFSGHGFTNRARSMIGALRDITVAGYGARAALYGVGRVTAPLREYQTLMAETKNKGSFNATQMGEIDKLARGMGRTTQYGPTQAMGAAVELAAAGVRPGEMGTALPSTLRFAQSSGLSTQQSGSLLVETASQLGLQTDQFERIGDVMTKAANMSTISVADMGQSLKYVGTIGRTAGLDLEFLAGTIALLGENGLKGEQGGTALRRMLSGLVHPSKRAKEALAGIGLSGKDLAAGIGSPEALQALFRKMNAAMDKKGASAAKRMEINKLVFGEEGITAADILTRASMDNGAKGWAAYTTEVRKAAGAMREAAETMGGTLNGRIEAMKARWETAAVALTERFLPAMNKVTTGMTDTALLLEGSPWLADVGVGVGGTLIGAKIASSVATSLLAAESTAAITAAGLTLGGTLAIAIGTGITAYAGADFVIKKLGLKGGVSDMEGRSFGSRGIGQADQDARNAGSGIPLSNEVYEAGTGSNAGRAPVNFDATTPVQPFNGALDVNINLENGRATVKAIRGSDGRLRIGANVVQIGDPVFR